MSSEATQNERASAYLMQLQALGAEIDIAIDAISGNAVGRLQESVSKQEMLCISVARMANAFGAQAWAGAGRVDRRSGDRSGNRSGNRSGDFGTSATAGLLRNEAGPDTMSADTVSADTAPADTMSADTMPGDTAPSAELLAKIDFAKGALLNSNLRYAALLKHSGDSIALLASLCRSHTGQFQEARGPRLKQQTWSCEM